MRKIVVLMGGFNSEAEVSKISGDRIFTALSNSLFIKENNIIVEKYILTSDIIDFCNFLNTNANNIIVFNALHGKIGEDGHVQALLNLFKVPYTHSGLLTSSFCMDKSLTKALAKSLNMLVAKEQLVNPKTFDINKLTISLPLVLKPIDEGSSVNIYIAKTQEDLKTFLQKMHQFDLIMLEEYIKGHECTIGVLDGIALETTEIVPAGEFYDYNSKYSAGQSKHYIPPINIPIGVQELLKKQSVEMFKAIKARGAIRLDFIINEFNEAYFLEVNTQPGFTPLSLLPEQAEYSGISYEQLCLKLLNLATYDK
jgi:D-alanine-D-alanine ligase